MPSQSICGFINKEQPDDLILVVGSSPLPNYVAAAMIRPKRVHLVYSAETEAVLKNLSSCLESRQKIQVASRHFVNDATKAEAIAAVACELTPT